MNTLETFTYIPRGQRNHNPFNIRRTKTKWLGSLDKVHDKEFEEFENYDYGIRAGVILFRTYIRKYKLRTPREFITRFAPASENDTNQYFKFLRLGGVSDRKSTRLNSSHL